RDSMRVTERSMQAEDIVSLTLVPASGAQPPAFQPGQYVTVTVQLRPGVYQQRQYSLSDAPNGRDWRISVRREKGIEDNPAGEVSNWLHDNAHPGTVLSVSPPFGDFAPALNGDEPIALLSAGVGITPMVSVLNALAGQGADRKVVFAHAARRRSCVAHLRDVEAAGRGLPQLKPYFYLESGERAELAGTQARPGRMQA